MARETSTPTETCRRCGAVLYGRVSKCYKCGKETFEKVPDRSHARSFPMRCLALCLACLLWFVSVGLGTIGATCAGESNLLGACCSFVLGFGSFVLMGFVVVWRGDSEAFDADPHASAVKGFVILLPLLVNLGGLEIG